MDEFEIIATFDTEETAKNVVSALNGWFDWLMEGDPEEEIDIFEDFGLSVDDYFLDRENEIDWDEVPRAQLIGNKVTISLDSASNNSAIEELLEALGAQDVSADTDDDNP